MGRARAVGGVIYDPAVAKPASDPGQDGWAGDSADDQAADREAEQHCDERDEDVAHAWPTGSRPGPPKAGPADGCSE